MTKETRNSFKKGSMIACVYPLRSGIGSYAKRLFMLGFHERLVMFKIVRNFSEEGYQAVVKSPFNFHGVATYLSIFFSSRWSKEVQSSEGVHFASPDYFHLAKYNRNSFGTIHDLFPVVRPSDFSYAYRLFFKKQMEYADKLKGIVAVSETTRKVVKEFYPHLNVKTIHHWTGEEFRPRDKKYARSKLGLPLDRKIVLSIGSAIPRKNTELLPEVMNRLDSQFLMVRIGHGRSIEKRFRDGRCIFIEKVDDDMPLYYNAADVLISPSMDEGFGMTIIEAINSGTGVVASDIDAHREILGSYKYLVDPLNVDLWVEGIYSVTDNKVDWSSVGEYYREKRAKKEYMEFYES